MRNRISTNSIYKDTKDQCHTSSSSGLLALLLKLVGGLSRVPGVGSRDPGVGSRLAMFLVANGLRWKKFYKVTLKL